MSVNFYKNRDLMVNAWKDVMNDKSNANWVLFGYEKQSNDLTLVDSGDGGLDELFEQFNNSKILYAFCRVYDENTELTKYVFINWQGEGAPLSRKGVCVNHFRDVNDFFKGAHLTINARTEEDVEPQAILTKVSKVSAKVNLKDRLDITENMAPVGTNYKRVQPQREISQTDREKFWEKTQEEEKSRLVDEKKRAQEMRLKLDKEREDRELAEAKQRDAAIKEKEQKILKMREMEQNAANAMKNVNNEASKLNSIDDNERRKRSEAMRRERAEDAKSVISQNSIKSARAVFERNTSAGQLNSIKYAQSSNNEVNKIDSKLVPNSTISSNEDIVENTSKAFESLHLTDNTFQIDNQSNATNCHITENNDKILETHFETEHKIEEHLPIDYSRNLLQDSYIDSQPLEDIAEEQIYEDTGDYNNAEYHIREATNEPSIEDNIKLGDGLRARALFDYQAADETEISFDPDDIITHIEQIDEGWWQGMASNGTYGLFPANYVELIE